jgi:hypothetical protein
MYNTGFNWSNSAFTTFVVMSYNNAANTSSGILGSNTNSGVALSVDASDFFAMFKVGVTAASYNLSVSSTTTDVAVWKSAGVSSGNITTTFYKNGTAASATQSLSTLTTGTGAVVGASTVAGADPSPSSGAYEAIYEVLIYPSQLSDTDRGSVETYLKSKWGIA